MAEWTSLSGKAVADAVNAERKAILHVDLVIDGDGDGVGFSAMMRPTPMASVILTQDFRAPADRVFAALDDHANMGRWLGPRVSLLKRAPDGGVGTVRRVHAVLTSVDEEVIEREVPSRLVYRIIGGVPGVSHHRGEILVTADGPERSHVRWEVEMNSRLPGYATLMLGSVRLALGLGLKRLSRQLS
jgi:uncharacterized protein YndB with AHSA1/START domain